MALPPHEWDDEVHHTAIATCFDVWFLAHEQGNRVQAHRWQMELARLTEDARRRRPAESLPAAPRPPSPLRYGTRRCRRCQQPFPIVRAWAMLCDDCRRTQAHENALATHAKWQRRREAEAV